MCKKREHILYDIEDLAVSLKWLKHLIRNDLEYQIINLNTDQKRLGYVREELTLGVQEFIIEIYKVYEDIANMYDEAIINYNKIKGN